MVLSLLHRLGVLESRAFSLGADSGVAEVAQYLKLAAVGLALGSLFARRREPVYAAMAVLAGGLLLDDVTLFHETAGAALAAGLRLPEPPFARAQDLGEILALASWVGPVAVGGAFAYRASGDTARRHARWFGAAIAVLAGFGVVVDLVHQAFSTVWGVSFALEVVEEGGELVTVSALLVGVAAVRSQEARGPKTARGGETGEPG